MKGYKGFSDKFACLDNKFQYKENTIYTLLDNPEVCKKGFHFCEKPYNVLMYYPLMGECSIRGPQRYAAVESLGDIVHDSEEQKTATNKIRIGEEIAFEDFIRLCFKELEGKSITETGYVKLLETENSDFIDNLQINFYKHVASFYTQINAMGYNNQIICEGAANIKAVGHHNTLVGLSSSSYGNYYAESGMCNNIYDHGIKAWIESCGEDLYAITASPDAVVSLAGMRPTVITKGPRTSIRSAGSDGVFVIKGKYSILECCGTRNRVAGVKGTKVSLRGHEFVIDGDKYKEFTYYTLKDGEVVEWE